MKNTMNIIKWGSAMMAAALLTLFAPAAEAMISGISGPAFNLTAKAGHISTADGSSIYAWGYANGGGAMQYPGPTLIVNEGDAISIVLTNELSVPVSIVFPGQEGVVASGGANGVLTREALPGESVAYAFTASQPGTYLYHSGTRPEVQIEMGLVGAIIVRPAMGMMYAYNHMDSMFDRETLFLLTEMDPRIHQAVQMHGIDALQTTDYLSDYFPVYWFINGRNAPDTMFPAGAAWLPSQPYNCMPMMHPGEKLLMRVIGAGRDMHPFHHHGNHSRVIARDGRLLTAIAGADLSYEVFTVQSVPGETVDAIFEWTGAGLGWDIYGHDAGDPLEPDEDPADHGKPFPVELPELPEMTFGGFYSGSPFLGAASELPPGEGGLNPDAGYTYMWHSHTEKEMVNFDIFPGGMMTMLMIVPHGVAIMH